MTTLIQPAQPSHPSDSLKYVSVAYSAVYSVQFVSRGAQVKYYSIVRVDADQFAQKPNY